VVVEAGVMYQVLVVLEAEEPLQHLALEHQVQQIQAVAVAEYLTTL
jgi:hypothetical protein